MKCKRFFYDEKDARKQKIAPAKHSRFFVSVQGN